MRTPLVVLAIALVALLPACQMNERISGTVIGAVAGGVLGGVTSGAGGAVVGTLAGAVAGYLLGDYNADQRERGRPSVFGSNTEPGPREQARAAFERGKAASEPAAARVWFQKAQRLDPQHPAPYNALGVLSIAEGDAAGADRWMRKALVVDPAYAPARTNLARLHAAHPALGR